MKTLFLQLFLLCTIYGAIGQDHELRSRLKILPKENVSFSQTESKKIKRLLSNDIFSDYWIIDAKTLKGIISKDKANFTLPGLEITGEFSKTWSGSNRSGQLVWEGEARDGYATILMDDQNVFGHIRFNGEEYMLYSMEESHTSVLFKKERVVLTKDSKTCGSDVAETVDKKPSQKNPPDRYRFEATGNCDVRVLTFFTDRAEDSDPNVAQTALTAIAQTNTALRNSDVTANDLTIVSAGVRRLMELPNDWTGGIADSAEIHTDVDALANHGEADFFRNWARADLVVCLTSPDYGNFKGVVADFTGAAQAYALVTTDLAVSGHVYAHEVGHLFDCRHHTDNSGQSYARGHSFSSWFSTYSTIMVSPASGNRIPHFSNPSIYFAGKATGKNDRNNARRLRERACVVANYDMLSNPTLFATIYGVGSGYPGDELLFMASVSGGGPGAYGYQWRISNSATPSGPILSTNFELETTLPNNPNSTIYIHLRVTSADGQVRTDVQPVNIQGSGGPPPPSGFKSDDITKLTLYPNPADDKIIVSAKEVEKGEAKIRLYNALGELIQEDGFQHIGGDMQHKYTISGLPTGVYFVKIETANQQILGKFIKE